MNLHGYLAREHIHYGSEEGIDFTNIYFYTVTYYALLPLISWPLNVNAILAVLSALNTPLANILTNTSINNGNQKRKK